MSKDKKSRISDIKKLRHILDRPYDYKKSSSENNENLESIRKRLTGESSKTDTKYVNIDTTSKKYGRLEPRVTIYQKEEKAPLSKDEEFESDGKIDDIKEEINEEDIFKNVDLYEIEKVDISEPEFLEVKPKEKIIEQKKSTNEPKPFLLVTEPTDENRSKDMEDTDEKLLEWKSVDVTKIEETRDKKENNISEELPEFEKIEEVEKSKSPTEETGEDISNWEPVSEDRVVGEKRIDETKEKNLIKTKISSSLRELKPKYKKIDEEKFKILGQKKGSKVSKESILQRIISKKEKIGEKELPEQTKYKKSSELEPTFQESFDKNGEEAEPQTTTTEPEEDIPVWEPVVEESFEEKILVHEKLKEEGPISDEKERKVTAKEKKKELREKKKEDRRRKKTEKKEVLIARKEKKQVAKITKKAKLAEIKSQEREHKVKLKEEQRFKKKKEKDKLIELGDKERKARLSRKNKKVELKTLETERKPINKEVIKNEITPQAELKAKAEELTEWESYEVDDESSRLEPNVDKSYKYGEHTLYKKEIKTSTGKIRIIHFFSKKKPDVGEAVQFPEGYEVKINKVTKLPYLKKKK